MPKKRIEVAEWVRREIVCGRLGPGDRLPPRSWFQRNFTPNANVVNAAFRELAADGFVETRGAAARGTVVARTPPYAGRYLLLVKAHDEDGGFNFFSFHGIDCTATLSTFVDYAEALLFAPEAVAHALAGAQPPPETAAFLRCVAVNFVIDAAKGPVHNAVLAVGRVALYQSVDSIIMASGFIFAWGFLAAGFPAWTSVASVAATNALSFIFRFAYMAIAVGLLQKRAKQ